MAVVLKPQPVTHPWLRERQAISTVAGEQLVNTDEVVALTRHGLGCGAEVRRDVGGGDRSARSVLDCRRLIRTRLRTECIR